MIIILLFLIVSLQEVVENGALNDLFLHSHLSLSPKTYPELVYDAQGLAIA